MRRLSPFVMLIGLIVLLSLALGAPAWAGVLAFSGSLDTSDPTINRPNDTGTGLSGVTSYFDAVYFTVDAAATYTITMTSGFFNPSATDDGFFALYVEDVSAGSPLIGLQEVDDDAGAGLLPRLVDFLEPTFTYVLVIATGNPLDIGSYSVEISGTGNITFGRFASGRRFGDGRVNNLLATDAGAPVAVYCRADGGISVYFVSQESSRGSLVVLVTRTRIEAVGVPTENTLLGFLGNVRVYRLTTGEFQLNAAYPDGKPYTIVWDSCPATRYYHVDL
ncbi:MAG: hypothetical protein HXY40_13330 [Chloroflexi bacterium]|nr:hypothetical protein [Chloroflexota bacterium]